MTLFCSTIQHGSLSFVVRFDQRACYVKVKNIYIADLRPTLAHRLVSQRETARTSEQQSREQCRQMRSQKISLLFKYG